MKKTTALSLFLLVAVPSAKAQTKDAAKIVAEEKAVKWRITDVLDQFKGQMVTLILRSGQEVTGRLASIKTDNTPNLVYLTELSDKSYYGSLIQVAEIVGVTFRNVK